MTGTVSIQGQVLEVEHKQGTFNERDFDFKVAHVLVGRKVVEVRYNPDNGDARPPAEGDTLSVEVEVPKGVRLIARRSLAADKPTAVRTA
jgi:hypothetical protein